MEPANGIRKQELKRGHIETLFWPIPELLGYQAEGALVECGACHQVYILAPHPETGGFPWETEDMPVIEWNYDGPDSDEVNLFGDAPEGDGYSW